MTQSIIYDGSNEAACVEAVEKFFGREANLGFKYFCNDASMLPDPAGVKNLVVLTTTLNEDDVSAYNRVLLIKVAYPEPIEVVYGKNDLETFLPFSRKFSSSVWVCGMPDAQNIQTSLLCLDRYSYMFFPKVAFVSGNDVDKSLFENMGFRALIIDNSN